MDLQMTCARKLQVLFFRAVQEGLGDLSADVLQLLDQALSAAIDDVMPDACPACGSPLSVHQDGQCPVILLEFGVEET